MNPWYLPETLTVGGKETGIHTDFRDILFIIEQLEDPDSPEWLRWKTAVRLFYKEEIPDSSAQEAMGKMAEFIAVEPVQGRPGPKLIDWGQDAQAILSGVNKVAGQDVRTNTHLHWWSFVSLFREIGEGQLSTIVSIRDKKAKGKKLEKWEKEYYAANKEKIDLKKRYSQEERQEIENLKNWL